MRYILPAEAIKNLDTLRQDYEKIEAIDLRKPAPTITTPTFFGGTDRETRKAQLQFIKKFKIIIQANLKGIGEVSTPAEAEANLTACRAMIAVCLYTQSQITGNSTLYKLINKKLGINSTNYLDEQDKELCFLAANRLLHQSSALEQANAALAQERQVAITEQEWDKLKQFVKNNCVSNKPGNPYLNYPITSITQPLFGTLGRYTGQTVGVVTGDFISHSSANIAAAYQLTALIGGSFLILGPAGPSGIAGIFGTVIASKLVNTFCKITLSNILGVLMDYLGQAIGFTIGLPFDLVYQGISMAGSSMINYSTGKNKNQTGLRITDGVNLIDGLVFELKRESEMPANATKIRPTIDDDGYICINGVRAVDPNTKKLLPPLIVDEFQAKLKLYEEEENQDDAIFAL